MEPEIAEPRPCMGEFAQSHAERRLIFGDTALIPPVRRSALDGAPRDAGRGSVSTASTLGRGTRGAGAGRDGTTGSIPKPYGFPTSVAAFATDLPSLTNWETPYLYGPGSVHVAHTDDEHVSVEELEHAVDSYVTLARAAVKRLAD